MKILIVEDEARIAKRVERMTRDFFGEVIESLVVCESIGSGLRYLNEQTPDLLLLDLNLNGEDGFDLLKSVVSGAFHCIIISAYTERAITAFAYGVLDFVPKPFDQERLDAAFKRLSQPSVKREINLEYLAVRKAGSIILISIKEIRYIKGAGIYTELHLLNGKKELHDKSLEKLEQLLPSSFERIHKSYIVPITQAEKIIVQAGGKYLLELKNEELLPIGRSKYKELRQKIF
ncbi:LytTR family DNA-binding domain-containing protein [Pedobacter nototheniae]|uniref:LytR/AlgR family response regulator transcription factor n=1 Tax=Pedobacter nototheniae TaxID=2488994 RepID=UPI0029318F9E|nr:LytTR family DNA-binding domain-containing protein [Pedobacter nototheniae]